MTETLEGSLSYYDLISLIKIYFKDAENIHVIFNGDYEDLDDWSFCVLTGLNLEYFVIEDELGLVNTSFALSQRDLRRIIDWHLRKRNDELRKVEFGIALINIEYKHKFKLNETDSKDNDSSQLYFTKSAKTK